MKLLCKDDMQEYEIYDITYNQTGFPQFLIFKNNQWLRISAKHFRPDYYVNSDGTFIYFTGTTIKEKR